MLGAATVLASTAPAGSSMRRAYGADAARFATHLVEHQTQLDDGRVLVDSCDWGKVPCHDCSQFKGIAYRELTRWALVGAANGGNPLPPASTSLLAKVRTVLDASAEAVWARRQEQQPESGSLSHAASPSSWSGPLFGTGWALGSARTCPPSVASQGSAVMALLGHATLERADREAEARHRQT